MAHISTKISLTIISQVFLSIFGFISIILVARFLGSEILGSIGFSLSIVGIFSLINQLGFKHAHIKRISEGLNFEDCLATFIWIKITLTFLFSTITFFYVFWFTNFTYEIKILICIFILYFSIQNLANIFINTYQGLTESAKENISLSSGELSRILGTFFVVFMGLGAFALSLTYVLSSLVTLVFCFYFFKGYKIGNPSLPIFKSYFSYAIAVFIPAIFGQVATNIDKIFIGLYWDAFEVGQYFAIQKLILPLLFISSSFQALLMPQISKHKTKNNDKEIENLVYKSERYLSFIFIPVILICIFFSELIIKYTIGNEFKSSHEIIIYLSLMLYFLSITRPYLSYLMGINKPNLVAFSGISVSILNIFLNIIFIPEEFYGYQTLGLGAKGAAIATFIAMLASFFIARFFSYKNGKIVNYKISFHILVILFAYYSFYTLDLNLFYNILISFTFIVGAYLFFYIINEIGKEDILTLKRFFSISNYYNYIRDELKHKD